MSEEEPGLWRYVRVPVSILAVLTVLVASGAAWSRWANRKARLEARADLIRKLAGARDVGAMKAATEDLGVFLQLENGSWIAVAYAESHTNEGYSVSIALSSDGRWFECSVHSCGGFKAYRRVQKQHAEKLSKPGLSPDDRESILLSGGSSREGEKWLNVIEAARTLDEAAHWLGEMGFRAIPSPAEPNFKGAAGPR